MIRLPIGCILSAALVFLCAAQEPPNPSQLADLMPDFVSVAVHSDGRKVWAAASNGFVFQSEDGGTSWNGVGAPVPGEGDLNVVRFHSDGVRGWAGGDRGRLAYTSNGGSSWNTASVSPKETGYTVEDIAFDSTGKRGVAVGWDVILTTEDAGLTWQRAAAPQTGRRRYNSVAFDGEFRRGIAAGFETLALTEDGGKTWKEETGDLQSVAAVWISQDGVRWRAFSSPATNARDKDETYWFEKTGPGRDFSRTKDLYIDNIGEVAFRGNAALIAEGEGIRLKASEASVIQTVAKGKFRAVAFAGSGQTALAVGDKGRVDRTEDGGKTWRTVHQWPDIGECNDILLQPGTGRVWAVGEKVLRAEYPGWKFVEQKIAGLPGQIGQISAILFSRSGEVGWMTARSGHILRTADKGERWSVVHQFEGGRELRAIAFDSAGNRGIAVGDAAALTSEDGGRNWAMRKLPAPEAFLNSVWISADGKTAFAVTGSDEKGRIYRSENHGVTWKEVLNPTDASLFAITFSADGQLGWISGSDSTMLRTQNGGRTWSNAQVIIPDDSRFKADTIFFGDLSFERTGRHGWVVGSISGNAGLFRTFDSGRSWYMATVSSGYYEKITFTESGNAGWALASSTIHATLRATQAPQINRFVVNAEDHVLELSAADPDTPDDEIWGLVEVSGRFLGPDTDKLKRWFRLRESEGVEWPGDIFREHVTYTFTLHLTDGWNVATQQFRLRGITAVSEADAPSVLSLKLEEMRGVNLAGARVLVDGREVPIAEVLTRGSDGTVTLKPSPAVIKSLPDGFHALTLTRSNQDVIRRIGFYKQQLSLKLFRPYGASYALIVAVGDYPVESGYRKLPNAVPQARQLETKLRAQGFMVLPLLLDRDATKARIEAAIRSAPAKGADRLLVYFGGHGDDEKGFQDKPVGYLVPYDGRKSDLWGTAIPLEKVLGEYSSRLPAKHVLFALDSCQSGLAVSRGGVAELRDEELKRFKALAEIEALSSDSGRTVLAAGTGGQDAIDVSGGIFTTALTEGISGKADADRNGVVDYFELFAYVWGRVNAESRQWLRKQQPSDAHVGGGRWVFVYQ
jgi:photosystem II stability/assembly factor-like uncharacterized protein